MRRHRGWNGHSPWRPSGKRPSCSPAPPHNRPPCGAPALPRPGTPPAAPAPLRAPAPSLRLTPVIASWQLEHRAVEPSSIPMQPCHMSHQAPCVQHQALQGGMNGRAPPLATRRRRRATKRCSWASLCEDGSQGPKASHCRRLRQRDASTSALPSATSPARNSIARSLSPAAPGSGPPLGTSTPCPACNNSLFPLKNDGCLVPC